MQKKHPKRTYESIKEELENKGYELTTTKSEYTATYKPISVRCPKCKKTISGLLCNFRKSNGCRFCTKTAQRTYEQISELFASEGCLLLTPKHLYCNTATNVDYLCSCGKKDTKRPEAFRSGQRCKSCGYAKISGSNNHNYGADRKGDKNPNWNPALTDEERAAQRNRGTSNEYHRWRRACHVRDNWTCQKCNKRSGELNVHHVENFSSNKDRRYDVTNGITLCKEHHDSFHQKYGKQNNNREQLEYFLCTS